MAGSVKLKCGAVWHDEWHLWAESLMLPQGVLLRPAGEAYERFEPKVPDVAV